MPRTRTKVTPELRRRMQSMVDMLSAQGKNQTQTHKTVAEKMKVSPATVNRNTDWPEIAETKTAAETFGPPSLAKVAAVAMNGQRDRLRILLGVIADYELEAEERSELVLICKEIL